MLKCPSGHDNNTMGPGRLERFHKGISTAGLNCFQCSLRAFCLSYTFAHGLDFSWVGQIWKPGRLPGRYASSLPLVMDSLFMGFRTVVGYAHGTDVFARGITMITQIETAPPEFKQFYQSLIAGVWLFTSKTLSHFSSKTWARIIVIVKVDRHIIRENYCTINLSSVNLG